MEWLDQLSLDAAAEAAPSLGAEETALEPQSEEAEVQPVLEEPVLTGDIPSEATPTPDDEEGLAWLEDLAAKQGVADEELITSPHPWSGSIS
jgi:hypothetical protein